MKRFTVKEPFINCPICNDQLKINVTIEQNYSVCPDCDNDFRQWNTPVYIYHPTKSYEYKNAIDKLYLTSDKFRFHFDFYNNTLNVSKSIPIIDLNNKPIYEKVIKESILDLPFSKDLINNISNPNYLESKINSLLPFL